MEQTPSSSGRSPELPSVSPPFSREIGGAFSNPETANGSFTERQEQRSGVAPQDEQSTTPPVAPPIPVAIALPGDDATTTPRPVSGSPTVANDDELIETEWVNKAKKVIAETKDDPYRREQEVSRLQADYLAKRYGRELGSLQ